MVHAEYPSYSDNGIHATIDLFGCDMEQIENPKYVMKILKGASEKAGAKILGEMEHKFKPMGYTAILMLSESHISIHTFPERGSCSIDVYVCSIMKKMDLQKAIEYICKAFIHSYKQVNTYVRGIR